MNVLIVYAHPEPKSFDGEMKDKAIDVLTGLGHAVQVSDLYEMRFKTICDPDDFTNPLDDTFFNLQQEQWHAAQHGTFAPDILLEQEKLVWADLVLFQFPLWWYSVPAILKGWIDRVLAFGFAYGQGHSLAGRRAMLVITTGGPPRLYTAGMRDAIIDMLDYFQRGTLHFCGFEVLPPFAVYGAGNATPEQREQFMLQYIQVLRIVDRIIPIKYEA